MKRRLLFTAATAGVASALVPDSALAERIDATLHPDIDHWDERIARLGCDHMSLGADAMRPKLFNDLTALTNTPQSGSLSSHAAKLCMLYGRALGATAEARRQYGYAHGYAEASGERDTLTWVYGRTALGLSDDPDTAHLSGVYAERALAVAPTGHDGFIGTYIAHYAKARSAAVLGNAEWALSAWEQARYAYDRIDPDLDGTEWSYAAWRFYMDGAYVLYLCGRAAEADELADQARAIGVHGRFDQHLALHPLVGRCRAGDAGAADEARAIMSSVPTDQHSSTLRLVASQAGAREYLTD